MLLGPEQRSIGIRSFCTNLAVCFALHFFAVPLPLFFVSLSLFLSHATTTTTTPTHSMRLTLAALWPSLALFTDDDDDDDDMIIWLVF